MKVSELFEAQNARNQKKPFETAAAFGSVHQPAIDVKSLSEIEFRENPKNIILCNFSEVTSLVGLPAKFTGYVDIVDFPKLHSLEGLPQGRAITTLSIRKCPELKSLEFLPKKITKSLNLIQTGLTSLQGIHKHFKGGFMRGDFYIAECPIKSHILGLLLIPELSILMVDANKTNLDFKEAIKILKPYLTKIHIKQIDVAEAVIDCQQELIDAGLKAFAQL